MKIARKRILALLMALLFILSALPVGATAIEPDSLTSTAAVTEETEQSVLDTVTYIHPLYRDIIHKEDILQGSGEGLRTEAASYPKYSSVKTAGAVVREAMKARKTELTFQWGGSVAGSFLSDICDEAMKHTRNPIEGDYLLFQTAYQIQCVTSNDGKNYVICRFLPYTTPEEEKQTAQKSAAVLKSLHLEGLSSYQKVEKIYDYICTHTQYDDEHFDDYLPQFTAYGALIKGKAVCQGISVLFYRLALAAGVDNRVIASIGREDHAWNIVRLGSLYYNIDATWDAQLPVKENFLKGSSSFTGHTPNADYVTAAFRKAYPISVVDFDPEIDDNGKAYTNLTSCAVQMKTESCLYDGKTKTPAVTVKDGTKTLKKDTDYTVSYADNQKAGKAKVTITGKGAYLGTVRRTFEIKPGAVKMSRASSVSGGVKVSWKAARGAASYWVYRKSDDEEWEKVGITSSRSTSYTDKTAKSGTVYSYVVRAYSGGVKGDYDESGKIACYQAKPTLTSAANSAKKAVQVKWKKSEAASGYQLQYSTSSKFKAAKTLNVGDKTLSKKISKLKKKKTYYVRVRAVKKTGGKTWYSSWSSVKKVKIKK